MDRSELVRRLAVLDTKCSALLQLSAVVLALNMISASIGEFGWLRHALGAIIASLFLATSFLSLLVICVNWEATESTLRRRTFAYRIAIIATAIGLVCMVGLTISSIGIE